MWNDPIVEEVRKIRDEYARLFNYDLRKIFENLMEKEKQRKSVSHSKVKENNIK